MPDLPSIPILMYHDVEAAPRPPKYNHFYVLQSALRNQMSGLLRAGYMPVGLRQAVSALRGDAVLPRKPFVVTFDDGYKNLLARVHPLMRDLDIPYTVFLVSERIGGASDWVAPAGYEPSPLLNWSDIDEMRRWPKVDFQAHTATHVALADVPIATVRDELTRCKIALEQRLQSPVASLCYPYGSVSGDVAKIAAEAGYEVGLTTQFGRVRAGDDPMLLPRVGVHYVPRFSLKYGPASANFWWRVRTREDTRLPRPPRDRALTASQSI